ncbi:sugar ABC transporter substrate-binding protein [Clostridium sp. AF19-22AC]|jgi:inositol transport system substrate-binding protein|uniref:Monosaccharide ABC transporter substrate-binding protein (CUT2 family) n=1 Tax=Faecalicatena orotica TaxID=1544 RepID=A0A2Y9C4Y6_9FIRM|nr:MULTISPECIES: sugar ABC transporter substrate-binding protein [Clostridia]PWJ30334.1 monosaccharide ABC transporter substrate-binding protein (CUT2 family) [Faecalicatena orotica]RHR21451.1 sugar ABC transporter substrate-binding protein [Clostridium sp. AF19-22AC]SSA55325.1 monosaccharide ABC transporter substrate-binding protein, CUT2 family [Faecalicatena orotica]
MKAKKIGALLLAAVMTFSLAACGGGGKDDSKGDSSSAGSSSDKKRVCFVARASADTFAAWLTTEMKKEAKNYDNIELTCVSGEGDDNKENGLLEDCVTKAYDLVIVQSNNNGAQAPYVQQLVDAGIPVITTNPTTHQSDLDGSDDDSVMEGTGTVDADPVAQAKVSADRAVEEVPKDANVVVLNGPSGNFHADKRREAWTEYFFDKRPDVKILYEDYANWNSDEALTLMESWVQSGTHIDAIISMNDNMAAGAIEAIRDDKEYVGADGTPSFLAYGVDGTAQGCLLIKEGMLTSTALQSAADLAKKNMEYADKVVNGEMKVTEVNDYVDAPEINKDNVQEYIQMYIDNGEITDDGSLSE